MPATIKIKNSSTASAVPTSSDLVQGELAVNVTDRRLFTENASGTVVELGTNPTSITTGSIVSSSTIKAATTIGVGGATPSTSGSGITFPATQSASTDANTLDDYEEGTWTPTIGGNATYTSQNGRYTKIGRFVIVEFELGINTIGTGSSSDISGLPFAISTMQASGVVSYYSSLATSVLSIAGYGYNSSSFRFYGRTTAGTTAPTLLSIFGNGAYIQGNLIYTV